MKIDISNKNPYDAVADVIINKMHADGFVSDVVIARIKTTVLGESTEVLEMESFSPEEWVWKNDWYEGGEVELLGYIPLDYIVCDEASTKNWIVCTEQDT